MKDVISNFLLIVQFFTRIPVNRSLPCEQINFKRGSIFFPIIGLIVGTIQWVLYKLLMKILPLDASIVIILLIGVIVTGAMHIDGLGDTCDGFFAFKGNDRIIEIMKDSRIGTYACIIIIIDLLLKYSLFRFIATSFSISIIIVPVISRTSLLLLTFIGKNAKKTGTGNFLIGNIGKIQLFIGSGIGIGILILLITPKYSIILIFIAFGFTSLFNMYCNNKINGLTGDTLGANTELVELITLFFIAVMIRTGI